MLVARKPKREVKEAQCLSRIVNTGCLPSVLKPRVCKRLVDHFASNFNASYPPFWKAFR